MARTKAKAEPEVPASLPRRQPTAVTIRGSKEWREWLDRGANHCMTDVAKLIDVSVAHYLKSQGFEEQRPKR